MKITSIKESGSNATLLWALKNGADIKNDKSLQSIINDELFYLITINDVHYFELFRLVQMYREKVRIVNENKADVPSRDDLVHLFSGEIMLPEEGKEPTPYPMAQAVEYCCQNFINIVLQMQNDSDIISPSSPRLFLPMLTRTLNVQIPLSFADFVGFISPEDAPGIFNKEYPKTISSLLDPEFNNKPESFVNFFSLGFIKSTSAIRYTKQLNKYINAIKYPSLPSIKTDKLYKIALSAFFKYDTISRGEVRCSLFNINANELPSTLKRLKGLNTPLKFDFAIELPIQYMVILGNYFSREVLTMSYESSISDIIDGDLVFNDFIMPEAIEDNENITDEERNSIELKNNAINEYKIRLAEAGQILMNTMEAILNVEDNDFDVTATFALLPTIYRTRAIITIDYDKLADGFYENHCNDPLIKELFKEILLMANDVVADINQSA